ncbi:MAG: undecaprenyl-diphosphate phosphatase [Bacteroidales bacterium]|nr:undecaprenyl-diphosphate phosphatase [Bacteroidales bacterium]
METLEAIILGLVQGLTEFLPVSSSGHLQLGQHLFGIHEGGLTFDIVVHVATVLATLLILRKEIFWILKDLFKPLNKEADTFWQKLNDAQRYAILILISMIPIAIVGFCFKDAIEAIFEGSLVVVGCCLLITSVLLTLTHFIKPQEKENISPIHAFVIGVAQAIAVLPGLSRSGTTIATGLLLGNKKETLAQFSFLMVIPPILGEALLDFKHIVAPSAEYLAEHGASEAIGTMPLIAGFLAAFVSGCFACKWMIAMVKKAKLIYFAIYCVLAAILCFCIA